MKHCCSCSLLSLPLLLLLLSTVTGFAPATRLPASAMLRSGHPDTFQQHHGRSSMQLYATPVIDSTEMINFFVREVITSGVPTTFVIITILVAAKAFKGGGPNGKNNNELQISPAVADLYQDLYDTSSTANGKPWFLPFRRNINGNAVARNTGVPSEQYLSVNLLNKKYDSYQYNLRKATQSKAAASAFVREQSFPQALQRMGPIPPHVQAKLLQAEQVLLEKGTKLLTRLVTAETQLTDMTIAKQLQQRGVDLNMLDPEPLNTTVTEISTTPAPKNPFFTLNKTPMDATKALQQELVAAQTQLVELETQFVQNVTELLPPSHLAAFRAATLGDVSVRGAGQLLRLCQDRPLSALLGSGGADDTKSVFVLTFPGDIQASQVATLREEVTALCRFAKPGRDEVVLVLQSGGGTVTGYGLAAGQLLRLKESGLKLTICVEQVAASGGYMMCCVADRIVASPMAVLGSIGVISDIPNFYERLKEEGIEFQTVTAGKFKRTLTPTKKVNPEDVRKTKQDIEQILVLFKGFVHQNRPSLDIESVATGETWFGTDAMAKGLCDEIKTTDTVLGEYVDQGCNVYEVKYEEPTTGALAKLLPRAEGPSSGWIGNAVRWVVRTVAQEVQSELAGLSSRPADRQFMMRDETKDLIRFD